MNLYPPPENVLVSGIECLCRSLFFFVCFWLFTLRIDNTNLFFQCTMYVWSVCTASLQPMITMFQKCAQWSEKECLADQLGFKQRVATCVKMINIAVYCLHLGNYPVGRAMISGLGPLVTPSSLWEEVPEKYRNKHTWVVTHLMKGGFSTEGYNSHKRQFKGKF